MGGDTPKGRKGMGRFIDLTGQKIGEWMVIEYVGKSKWLCQCSCGEVREVLGKTLRNGTSKSCGHKTNRKINMLGKKVHEWTVVKDVGDGYWECICSCGNRSTIHGYDLRNNNSKNCGHGRKETLARRNISNRQRLEGKRFGEWEVLKYLGDKQYKCRCSCGRIKSVAANDLKTGISKSCGHNNGRNLIKDITGKKYGELEVVKYLGRKVWECRCSCGKHTKVLKGNLLNGSVRSCGCQQYDRIEKQKFIEVINEYINEYGEKPFVRDLSVILDRHEGRINRYINRYGLRKYINSEYGSRAERDIHQMFDGGILHDRQILRGKELAIYYPEHKLAIEFNGRYWHSVEYKDMLYHQNKTIDCAKKGIQLIHIFEHEWIDESKRNKIISLLEERFNKNKRIIYARNTKVEEIDTRTAKEFLDKYHLQNHVNSSINVGCYYNDELIGTMTFGKPRFNSEHQYELIRLAWKYGVAVVGGSERIFKHFLGKYKPDSIITYCDIAKFTGNVYTKLGFKTDRNCITRPNYVWVNTLENSVLSRYQTMKHQLVADGLGTKEQTEEEIMASLGYVKIYDSGNLRLVWKNNQT